MKKPAVIVLLLLSLLFIASEEMAEAEEVRMCETQSRTFHGLCVSNSNCASICQGEGFTGGQCKGLRRRCMCSKPCDGGN